MVSPGAAIAAGTWACAMPGAAMRNDRPISALRMEVLPTVHGRSAGAATGAKLHSIRTPVADQWAAQLKRTIMKLSRRQFLRLGGAAAAVPAVSRFARAQSYPSRQIRFIIGYP